MSATLTRNHDLFEQKTITILTEGTMSATLVREITARQPKLCTYVLHHAKITHHIKICI